MRRRNGWSRREWISGVADPTLCRRWTWTMWHLVVQFDEFQGDWLVRVSWKGRRVLFASEMTRRGWWRALAWIGRRKEDALARREETEWT